MKVITKERDTTGRREIRRELEPQTSFETMLNYYTCIRIPEIYIFLNLITQESQTH